ncbi:alanine racemase [Breznakiella homolactica]|uniref:Alanine racemase n=1 Tax=Breznakiella homolactica TaxID=2798577 RepID=A0A7T7XR16_9SPIR|nr:alanine racemase [Breznakiella homolactica]QQO10917.1 alanine racemase [Breznakiella homolactica]
MFLRFLRTHNPELIDSAAYFLGNGFIEPDTYVLDMDAIESNAGRLLDTARENGVTLYCMAKQVGRNPELSRRVLACTASGGKLGAASGAGRFSGMVAVDFREARTLRAAGLPVRHLGHLGQLPKGFIREALEMKPEVITVYSLEKAAEISAVAADAGMVQDILLRVWDDGDIFYSGQEGGFPLEDLRKNAEALKQFKGIRIAGVTSFPCFLYSEEKQKALPTPNAYTIGRAADILRSMGIDLSQINMPSCNSPATIPIAAGLGATHAEPGHSLTGTTPDNLTDPDPLIPAMVYVTEISHGHGGGSYCYGGGHYRRGNVRCALVRSARGYEETAVETPPSESIDYYFQLRGTYPVSSPVFMAFRTQIFVTRSRVALVEGCSRGKPSLIGIWDAQGNPISEGGGS